MINISFHFAHRHNPSHRPVASGEHAELAYAARTNLESGGKTTPPSAFIRANIIKIKHNKKKNGVYISH